jgi:N-acetylneuraminic acid mutarotase
VSRVSVRIDRRRFGLLLAGIPVLGLPGQARAQGSGAWTAKAPLPAPRFGLHSAVLDGKIFVMGGEGNVGAASVPTGAMHVYDPAVDAWREAAAMPTGRGFFGTAASGGRIYAIGGSPNMQEQDPGIGVVEIYDATIDGWARGRAMPTPRADLTANDVVGRIYAIGGTRHVGIEALGTVEEYDPQADTWTRKSDMPSPRLHLSSAVVDGKIIVVGGGPEWPVPSAATEMYDPATDAWTQMADMPTPRVGVWAAALNGKVYVMGGLSWENEALSTVEEFDPQSNTWRKVADMPTARFILAAEAAAGQVFAIGGAATDFTTLTAVEAFTP